MACFIWSQYTHSVLTNWDTVVLPINDKVQGILTFYYYPMIRATTDSHPTVSSTTFCIWKSHFCKQQNISYLGSFSFQCHSSIWLILHQTLLFFPEGLLFVFCLARFVKISHLFLSGSCWEGRLPSLINSLWETTKSFFLPPFFLVHVVVLHVVNTLIF